MVTNIQYVPDGYQRTEVGVIPEEWKVTAIGDISNVIRGASPRPKGDPRYYGGEVPRLMVEDVTRDGKFVFPSVDSLTQEGAKLSRPCSAGTLTIVCSGTVGVPAILGVDACIHDGFLALKNVSKLVDGDFLYHQVNSLRSIFDGAATHGGVFTNLTTTILKEFYISLPSPDEQTAIAEALTDADEAIRSLEAVIAKKRDVKQATLHALLTPTRRLPGFSGVWETTVVASLVSIKTGSRNTQDKDSNGQYPFFVRSQQVEAITTFGYDCEAVLTAGDGVGTGKIFHYINGKFDAHQRVYIMSDFSNKISSKYFYFVFKNNFYGRIMQMTAKSSVDSVRREMIADMSVKIPPTLEEQTAIATILSDMDSEIEGLETRLDKLRDIKQGMMQVLLTGKVRLI